MPYPLMKKDEFTAFGGINMKASQADLNVFEFLDISNMDFTATGALQQRPGSQTFCVSALNVTLKFAYTGVTGSINQGTTQSLFVLESSSFIGGNISSIYEFSNLQGSSYILFSAPGYFATLSFGTTLAIAGLTLNQIYYTQGGSFAGLLDTSSKVISNGDAPTNPNWSFTSFVNRVFFCNGDHFYKWDGDFLKTQASTSNNSAGYIAANGAAGIWSVFQPFPIQSGGIGNSLCLQTYAYKFGLPPGTSLYANGTTLTGGSLLQGTTYTYSYGYVNERGFYGPVSSPITVFTGTSFNSYSIIGFSNAQGLIGFSGVDGYGIGTSIISNYFGTTTYSFQAIAVYRDNGPGTGRFLINTAGIGAVVPFPYTQVIDNGIPTSTIPEPTCIFATLMPQYLEIFNNQLFMCGFSLAPSTVQFSDIGNPESIQPNNNFDVRTNDGDYLTGMKQVSSRLFLFKNKSFHVLQGDNPQNFVLNAISDQYGCISSRAIATYKDYLVFLDKKGIAIYNGANIEILSTKLDPLFATMNVPAAQNNAWMVHHKDRNQIWCGIPINGSTQINQIVVYDYLLNAFTHFDGLKTASAAVAFGDRMISTVYFGGYSSFLGRFGSSLTSDFGNGITVMAKTRFITELGQSIQKMWRRLSINQVSAIGATISWNVNYYADYQSTVGYTNLMSGNTFQIRSDFGIPAKSLSIQVVASNSSDIMQLQGYTIESRFQRNQ